MSTRELYAHTDTWGDRIAVSRDFGPDDNDDVIEIRIMPRRGGCAETVLLPVENAVGLLRALADELGYDLAGRSGGAR